MTATIEVLLFDLGGVLVEVTGVSAIQDWTSVQSSPASIWEKWLVSPAVRAFETGRIDADQFARQLIREMSLPVTSHEFLASFSAWPRGLFPGARELLNRIPSGYTLAAFSNSNVIHWPRVIKDMGLGEMFGHVFASHLIGKIKPDLEAFEHVLNELACDPARVLYVDDNLLNVDAARRLGMQAMETKGIDAVRQVLKDYEIFRN